MTGEEDQIGGFDRIYANGARVKNGMRNTSFLGCLNNRHQQMRKMAKATALRLAEKFKEEKEKEKRKEEKNKDNKNTRNRSTNFPSSNQNQMAKPSIVPVATSNTAIMNKSGNSIRKPVSVGAVKLPKVSTIVSNNMSNTSVKAIGEMTLKREGPIMPGSK